MPLFSSKLTYGDFSRTGAQDCANAVSIDEFDYEGGGTARQIVERTWAQWEDDGMEEQWLEQQDDFEGLDPHKAYEAWAGGWKERAVGYVESELERRKREREDEEEHDNPPPKWWHRPSPSPRACYRTKADALKAFLDTNSAIVENYGGADYEVSPSEFDSINHKYDLKGKRAARSIADAVWAAMPVGRPYCLDRIDLDALNDTSPAREAGVAFRLPDINYELQARAEEAAHYAQHEDVPEWVTEHEREPHRVFPPIPSMDDIVPVRLTLEEQEPGVATFRMNPKGNPAWVTKILSKHFVDLEEQVPPKWLPKLTRTSASAGKMTATMKEYGCGAYGCVLPTLDPGVVLKLTTDLTEAQFAHDLAATLSRPVVVKYHLTRALPDKYKGRDAFLLWRDSADMVGKVIEAVAERGGDVKLADKAIAKQHRAAQDAFDALNEGLPAQKLLDRWVDAADEMGRAVPELSELARNMIAVLRKDKVFFGDVHDGNIGLVNGHWVIVDPGHVAVLQT